MGGDDMDTNIMESDEEASRKEESKSRLTGTVAKLEIPYNSSREAEIVRNTLQVDPEPKRGGSSKTFKIKDNLLCVEIRSPDVRQLRTAVNSFMDLLNLVTKTVDQFGPPLQQSKKVCL